MSDCRLDFEHRDLVRMYKTLDKLGQSPQKAVNKGTSKAAQIVKKSVKSKAPEGETGMLKKNIITKTERSRFKGKKVREATMRGGADANSIFQKDIVRVGLYGGRSKKGYYPASMEYGFLTRVKGSEEYLGIKRLHGSNQYQTKIGFIYRYPSRQVEGRHFMREGAESASEPAKDAMIKTMTEELEKLWKEK